MSSPTDLAPDLAWLELVSPDLTAQVVFPNGADTIDRANLLGATILIDFSYFETQNTA